MRFIYHYRFLATEPGSYTVGPFHVTQGSTSRTTRATTLKLREIQLDGKQRVRLVLPNGPIFMGQRIPVQLEWWLETDLVERLLDHRAHVPLFEMSNAFRFEDKEDKDASSELIIELPSGAKKFPATARRESWQNKDYVVVTVTRTLIPLKTGKYPIKPATMITEEGVRWRRDFFGGRRATHMRKLRTQDQKRTLSVKALPTANRPASFAGAVGNGFSMEVSTDRSVVQVGDPIRLTITLHSEAEAHTAALPPLTAGGGLSPREFRVPAGEIAGIYKEGAKQFEVTIRVLDENVHEIPPLEYSWFDTDSGKYQSTHSRPIALSVRAAKMVSANDVVRNQEPDTEDDGAPKTTAAPKPTSSTANGEVIGRKPAFTLTGADLAIEREMRPLLASGSSMFASSPVQIACYLLGMILILAAFLDRRRTSVDPAIGARMKELKRHLATVEKAHTTSEIADALRRMAAITTSNVPRKELDNLLGRCDALVFAPGGATAAVDTGLREQALKLAVTMLEAKQ